MKNINNGIEQAGQLSGAKTYRLRVLFHLFLGLNVNTEVFIIFLPGISISVFLLFLWNLD